MTTTLAEITTETETESIAFRCLGAAGRGIVVQIIEREDESSPADDIKWEIWMEWNGGPHNMGAVKMRNWPTATAAAIEKLQHLAQEEY